MLASGIVVLAPKWWGFALFVVLAFLWCPRAVIFEALPEGTCLDFWLREMRSLDGGDVELL